MCSCNGVHHVYFLFFVSFSHITHVCDVDVSAAFA